MGEGGQWSGRRASRQGLSSPGAPGRGSCRADTEQQREEGAMATLHKLTGRAAVEPSGKLTEDPDCESHTRVSTEPRETDTDG